MCGTDNQCPVNGEHQLVGSGSTAENIARLSTHRESNPFEEPCAALYSSNDVQSPEQDTDPPDWNTSYLMDTLSNSAHSNERNVGLSRLKRPWSARKSLLVKMRGNRAKERFSS